MLQKDLLAFQGCKSWFCPLLKVLWEHTSIEISWVLLLVNYLNNIHRTLKNHVKFAWDSDRMLWFFPCVNNWIHRMRHLLFTRFEMWLSLHTVFLYYFALILRRYSLFFISFNNQVHIPLILKFTLNSAWNNLLNCLIIFVLSDNETKKEKINYRSTWLLKRRHLNDSNTISSASIYLHSIAYQT